jgi:hypothetical protein
VAKRESHSPEHRCHSPDGRQSVRRNAESNQYTSDRIYELDVPTGHKMDVG